MLLSPSRYGPGLLTPQSKFHSITENCCLLFSILCICSSKKRNKQTRTSLFFFFFFFLTHSCVGTRLIVSYFHLFSIVQRTSRASSPLSGWIFVFPFFRFYFKLIISIIFFNWIPPISQQFDSCLWLQTLINNNNMFDISIIIFSHMFI